MRVVVLRRLGHQDELRVVVAIDHAARDLPQPDLGTAQILQYRDLCLGLGADPPDRLEHRRMPVVRSVREIEPENVDPRLDHLSHHDGIRRRRTDRRHDLGPDRSKLLFMEGSHIAMSSRLLENTPVASLPRAEYPANGRVWGGQAGISSPKSIVEGPSLKPDVSIAARPFTFGRYQVSRSGEEFPDLRIVGAAGLCPK